MKLAIPKERLEGETRVAASPETVKKLTALGLEVIVEAGAGKHASFAPGSREKRRHRMRIRIIRICSAES